MGGWIFKIKEVKAIDDALQGTFTPQIRILLFPDITLQGRVKLLESLQRSFTAHGNTVKYINFCE